MMNRLLLYGYTIWNMKPKQIYFRIRKMLGLNCDLGISVSPMHNQYSYFQSVEELDFDPVFLSRFSADDFLEGKITFLHETEMFDWYGVWQIPERSPLWNFNLHYFEFLMSFVYAYENSREEKYLKAIENSISGWIEENRCRDGGSGWSSYTIALRLVYWFACLFRLSNELSEQFKNRMITSIYEQYTFLANHLEKDLLANHYFEDLKALVLCAVFFQDEKMLHRVLGTFKAQCREQILPDGMHFELSPMYHKIVLEGVMRVAVALRSIGRPDLEIEGYIQPMLDVAYSFEADLKRIPLFNDGGNNVAKSLDALSAAANRYFNIVPRLHNQLPDSGYYFFEHNGWRLIVDAGAPGSKYNPGHAHCDAMSYELFYHGNPVLVNCGTYAYQCDDRSVYRSTAAHNTVRVKGIEQAQCWGTFRLARHSSTSVYQVDENHITMEMKDQKGNVILRIIEMQENKLCIRDVCPGKELESFVHVCPETNMVKFVAENKFYTDTAHYAEDYGKFSKVNTYCMTGQDSIHYEILFCAD